MSAKRATIKDVAKVAGVGITTVSYVINGRYKEMRISEATMKKVLQVANALNYSPNPFAAGLKTILARFVTVRTGISGGTLHHLEIMSLLDDLLDVMGQNGYSIIYNPSKKAEKLSAEACVCFNMSSEEFFALGDENFIPLIAIDSIIDDPMFYQVNLDYAKAKAKADEYFNAPYDYVAVASANDALRNEILAVFPETIFVSELSEIQALRLKGNLLLTHSSLFKAFAATHRDINILNYDAHLAVRPQVVFDSIKNAVNRIQADGASHSAKI
ncbi:MAG: LacI family transcriptional regulator [Lachnospiraceae bacterium]|nr:LacI family transcriptional regulator [Lachnospiraceae bacterium]